MTAAEILKNAEFPLSIPEDIPCGDMPGDIITVAPQLVKNTRALMITLQKKLCEKLESSTGGNIDAPVLQRAVVAISGGSGSGKTTMASILCYMLNSVGVGAKIVSGDNYPLRIPEDNDNERLRLYRLGGIKGLLRQGMYTDEVKNALQEIWINGKDCEENPNYPWLLEYSKSGEKYLSGYLGTPNEIDFDDINRVISCFRKGDKSILMKRMGRKNYEMWYEKVDFSSVNVLVLEWTHANSEFLQGIDIPIFIKSTPEETILYRKIRNRDKNADSAFTQMVLKLEQQKLDSRAVNAEIVTGKEAR